MAGKTIHIGNTAGDFTVDKSNRTYVLDEGDVVGSGSILTDPAGNIDDIVLNIDGTVTYDSVGLSIGAANSSGNRIVIGATGIIDARQEGVIAVGDDTRISNSGSIFVGNDYAASIGIQSTGDGARIVNDGFLKAETGFELHGGTGNVIVNSGLLAGYPGTIGVIIDSAAGEKNRFVNSGEMRASTAVEGGAGDEKVINNGRMAGSVDLGDGDDTLVARRDVGGDVDMGNGDDRVVLRGKGDLTSLDTEDGADILDLRIGGGLGLSTTISGGMDDDVYLVLSSKFLFKEYAGGGTDTVRSSATFTLASEFENLTLTGKSSIDGTGNGAANILAGNGARNVLSGLSGADRLDGAGGNDMLTGGPDADTFAFKFHTGKDVVTDYIDGTDKIDLKAYNHGIQDFEDLAGRINQKGADVVITLTDGDRITLRNVDATNLETTDFLF